MSKSIIRPKGTQDILPSTMHKWDFLDKTIRDVLSVYGYKEIRTPVFEHTELFNRSIGDATDVVQKEMYTFLDKGERSITLRPEGTAGVVRAMLENSLFNTQMPLRLFYTPLTCYRYEKQQSGRYREFRQFGIELFGARGRYADAEVISVANDLFKALGLIEHISLELNSVGCPTCRADYRKALVEFFTPQKEKLCGTCHERLDKNPMRLLDCKSDICQGIATDAPTITDYLCESCNTDFEGLKEELETLEIPYRVNPKIVRGLDYYRGTVFEFVTDNIAKGTVCGGGRYDGLVEELGGNPLAGMGFGLGLERLIMLLDSINFDFPSAKVPSLYIVTLGERAQQFASKLVKNLRKDGIFVERDIVGRGIKPQMKYADKTQALYTIVLGDDELDKGKVTLKRMSDGECKDIDISAICEEMKNI